MQKYGRTVITALVAIGAGFLVIALAWNGTARASCVDCQIPYLLSGGALGLGLIAIGAGLLLFEAGRRAVAHLEVKLDEVVEVLRDPGAQRANGTAAATAPARPLVPENGHLVVVGRSSFHRADCRLVEGKEDLDFATLDDARERGLQPCRVCDPTKAAEPAVATRRKRR